MSQESNEVTRRAFTKAAVAAVAVPVLAPLAACAGSAPESSPAPSAAGGTPAAAAQPDSAAAQPQSQEPTPLARALMDAVRAQYGDQLDEAAQAKVQRTISGVLRTAEQLRQFNLPIATEPSFVYRVPGGAA
ncbi:hypothetical protein [Longimicrobium sp.]|uniref:hypothetical protein n=1 Tax=Longimicrobium sp. TaxID=2029185 RepID=UPI002E33AB4D|nr:hypothetical protein [Longimicrobium sp.]HEX6041706.1 hypothetical protein [Longimicrobium sp.]